ncbi:hypothetical protein [Hyphomicrobium sp. DMF-1]|uniref:hypothetical protein n=1 Tax=Hyphomicrobium sp. DMF-1 TaxID=3019544 RepID=UPI0022EBCE9D|nr:hypothetical protein [Hyphomicrobium sp. DMF-1]WBT36263.1 hypothetical protein PE058_11360 [Hyphomicrobium sp. DMF-1]
MADVIAFPQRMARDGTEPLERSIEAALASYLDLSANIERVITDLEKSIVALSANTPEAATSTRQSNSGPELLEQLTNARRMLEATRAEIESLKPLSSP